MAPARRELLMLEGLQAGLAWIIVLQKRTAFREAFAGLTRYQHLKHGREGPGRAKCCTLRLTKGGSQANWRLGAPWLLLRIAA
jgi:methyladenine glycosylase